MSRNIHYFVRFLLTYNYYDKIGNKNIKESLLFAYKRIKKYWILHIITLILMALLSIDSLASFMSQILNILLDVLLLQSWIPIPTYYGAFNGVYWFLSSLLFCYFMYPFIIKMIHKLDTSVKKVFAIIFFIFIMIFMQSIYVSPDMFGIDPSYIFHIFLYIS